MESDIEGNHHNDYESQHSKQISSWVNRSRRNSSKGNTVISVSGACKNYGSSKNMTAVLQNFNMTVQGGTIYSLLGASGCGKTTLLSCLVGLLKIDKGEIYACGSPPGTRNSGVPGRRVGFMPQETALFGMFTIKETLKYYATIYGLSHEDFTESYKFLMNLLELPVAQMSQRKIETLSGGQQRRVSFAVALIHNPELIILDEPTVGVDPILRQSIWNHLRNLVDSEKVTVLITTHYHEEAKYSDKVGFMRNGRLLLETSPSLLLKQYPNYSLEECILQACKQDECQVPPNINGLQNEHSVLFPSVRSDANKITGIRYIVKNGDVNDKNNSNIDKLNSTHTLVRQNSEESNFRVRLSKSCKTVSALTRKNFKTMMRNIGFVLFIFLIPSLHIAAICLAVGNDPINLKVGVINHDKQDDRSNCSVIPGCAIENLSCRYLEALPATYFQLIDFEKEDEALEEVFKGKLWGYLVFRHNFSASMVDRGLSGNYASLESINGSQIHFHLDMTNSQIGNTIRKVAFEAFRTFTSSLLSDCGTDPSQGDIPLTFDRPIYGTLDTNYREFFAPSIVLGLLFFFPLCSSGIQYISEKKLGIINRSLVAGVSTLEIMISYFITQAIVLIVQCSSALVILTFVFKVGVETSVIWAVILAILVGTCGVSMGFLCATVCKEELEAVLLAIGSFFPNFILSGMVWPIQGMPIYLQYLSYVLPCSLPCDSMRAILSKGFGIAHPLVWPGFVSITVWILLFGLLTFLVERFSKRK